MNETYVTIRGRLVADPSARTTRAGVPMTTFRIASSVRRQVSGQPGVWEDAETSFYDVATYKALATNVGASLRKGQPVTVHGRQHVRSWQKDDGTTWWAVEVVADAVGHDLAFGTAAFSKVGRGQGAEGDGFGRPGTNDGSAGPGFGPSEGGPSGLGAADTDPYVVEGGPGRGLGQVAGPARPGDDGRPGDGVGETAADTGPLIPPGDEAAA